MIIESLQDPASQELTLKMLDEKLPADMAALQFLIENDIIYSLVSELSNSISSRNLDGLITKLIAGMIKASPKSIDAEKFAPLVKTSTSIYSKKRFFNYISALSMACMVDISRLQWGARLFRHEFEIVMNEQAKYPNEPYISLTSNFYCAAIGNAPFSWIQPFISDLLDHVALNYTDKLAPDYSNEYIMAYQDIIVRLLKSSGDSLEFILKFISRPDIDILDIHKPQSAQFFSKVCLKNISDKGKFFNSYFSDFDIASGTNYVVTCVLALVKDKELFELLKLSSGDFKNWQKPDIYSFLRLMASQDFSAQYLLTNLPDLLSAHLIMVDRRLSDISVWNDMRETLRLLLANTNITLGNWSSSLSNCLYEMENGRRLNKNEPCVEIEYKTS